MKKQVVTTLGLLIGMGVSTSCAAHSGHTTTASFAEGFLHPLTGMDHLVALILLGVIAAVSVQKHALKFVSLVSFALLVGFSTGVVWSQAASAEILVTISMLVLPLCLFAYRIKGLAKIVAVTAMGLFSVSHGLVQGAEASGMLLQYGVGTMLASLCVLVLSMLVTRLVRTTANTLVRTY